MPVKPCLYVIHTSNMYVLYMGVIRCTWSLYVTYVYQVCHVCLTCECRHTCCFFPCMLGVSHVLCPSFSMDG
ncbi:Neuroligin-1 [Frankliniella fusca]|uniref:Neuroligin-1 n=1 Tax=Frankliniella fusca TaxID=407009 RepID=A0AAE1HCE0_9NEOP|nr:Neuroligin-1 [Frankliniella fusca]